MENYFLNRRTCRNFSSQTIPDNVLYNIIKKATKAPTCGNMQLYSVIITKDKENLNKLALLHYNQPAAASAPVILTVCADFNRFTQWCNQNKADAGFNNFHSFIMAMTDALILSQQIVTIAEIEGYATCYLGTVNYNASDISKLLKLPELVVPVASISIGYAAGQCEETGRLKPEGVIHNENYQPFNVSDIDNLYEEEEQKTENQVFIKENGKDNLAQVFSEIRYPRALNEKISKEFLELLRLKGFL